MACSPLWKWATIVGCLRRSCTFFSSQRVVRLLQRSEKKIAAPYSVLAQIYDFVMSHVNYASWANYVAQIAGKHGNHVTQILDIACGTGSLCFRLAEKGFTVAGSDLSLEMIKIAREKTAKAGLTLPLWCADMRRSAVKFQPDMIVSLYDSMNYLMSPHEWARCLDNVHAVLKPKGIFVFDVSTVHNSQRYFRRYIQRERGKGIVYSRKSEFDAKRMVQQNRFEIRLVSHPNVVFYEVHEQRIRFLQDIMQMVAKSRLSLDGCYHGFSFTQGTEKSERVHFVLKKQ